MANRLYNNIYIIDSASTAANNLQEVGTASWPREAWIDTVAFWSTSGGDFEMVFRDDTTNTAFRISNGDDRSVTNTIQFGKPIPFRELRVKTLVNGTGFLYFS